MRSIASIKNDMEAIDKDLRNINDVITNFDRYAQQGMVTKALNDYFIDESILIDQKNALINEYNSVMNYVNANGNNYNPNANPNNFNRGMSRPMNSHDPYNRVGAAPAMTRTSGNPYFKGGQPTGSIGSTGTTGIGTLGSQQPNAMERNNPQQMQPIQQAPIVPKKEPVLPNYLKEKTITVSLKDGKPFLSGVPFNMEPIALDNKKYPVVSPLWESKNAVYLAIPARKMKIPYGSEWDWFLDKPFSEIDFKPVEDGMLCIENILYYHIKDILENFAELGYGNVINTNEIVDIQNYMKDPDVPTSGTLLMKKVFDKIMLTRDNGGEGKDFITFDLNAMHIYYNSRTIDFVNIIKSFTTKPSNKFILTEESYSDLFHLLKSLNVYHGTLELFGGILFKFYVGKDKVNLVRL